MVHLQFEAERKFIFCSKLKIFKLQFWLLFWDMNQSLGYQLLTNTIIWFIIWKIEHAQSFAISKIKVFTILSRLMPKIPPKNVQFLANFLFFYLSMSQWVANIFNIALICRERKPLLNGVLIRGLSKDLIALWLIVLRKLILLSWELM